jgi:hypothetical protein
LGNACSFNFSIGPVINLDGLLTMVDPIRPWRKKAGEVTDDSAVCIKLEFLPIEPRVFANRIRDQEVPTDVVPVWDNVV